MIAITTSSSISVNPPRFERRPAAPRTNCATSRSPETCPTRRHRHRCSDDPERELNPTESRGSVASRPPDNVIAVDNGVGHDRKRLSVDCAGYRNPHRLRIGPTACSMARRGIMNDGPPDRDPSHQSRRTERAWYARRQLGLQLAGRSQGGRRRRHPATLGPLFHRLVQLAGARLPGHARRVVRRGGRRARAPSTASATASARGSFPELADRDDLWRLLATITSRKAIQFLRHQNRAEARRGPGARRVGPHGGDDGPGAGMAQFLSREPTPERPPGSPTNAPGSSTSSRTTR